MSRPKPTILLEAINKQTYKAEQVLEASAIYSVFYKDTPINLRTLHTLVSYPGPKYKKVSFSNPGHAFNLAERLKNIFSCDDFKVCQMVKGPEVSEDELKKWTTVTI